MRTNRAHRRGSWGTTLAIIGALAVIAIGFLVVPPMLAPEPSPTPRPSVADATPSTSPTPSLPAEPSFPLSPYASVSWELNPFPEPNAQVMSVTASGNRVVVIGLVDGAPEAWSSADGGESWVAAALPAGDAPVADAFLVVGPAAGADLRWLAVGVWIDPAYGSAAETLAWRSDDGGATWARQSVEPAKLQLTGLAVTPVGYIGAGINSSEGSAALWSSTDSATWAPVETSGLPSDVLHRIVSFTAGPGGLVVGGQTQGQNGHPATWLSQDGMTWTQTMEDATGTGRIFQLSSGPAGYVAMGQTFAGTPGGLPTLWISPDGRTWSARYPAGANGLQIGSAAINTAGTLLTLEQMEGSGPSTPIRFLRAGSDESANVDLPLSRPNLVALPDRFLAIGNCADTSSCAGMTLAIGLPVRSE